MDKKALVGTVAGTAASAAVATVASPTMGKVAGIVTNLAATRLVDLAVNVLNEKNRLKFEAWLHEVAACLEHASSETTVQVIEEHIDEPWAHGPLRDAVRAIRDDIDEAALSHLARLAAWQVRDRIPPDRWSRRAIRLLLDCDASMVAAVEHFTQHVPPCWPKDYGDPVRIAMGGPDISFFGQVTILPVGGRVVAPTKEHAWVPHPLYRELFSLFRAHQFATEESGRHAHEGKMLMAKAEAVYLVRLFQGTAAASRL